MRLVECALLKMSSVRVHQLFISAFCSPGALFVSTENCLIHSAGLNGGNGV